jgi:hypothetical protein
MPFYFCEGQDILEISAVTMLATVDLLTEDLPCIECVVILGAFTELQKATLSFVISVRLSVRMEHLGSHWTNFHEILYLRAFRKSAEKIQVSLESDKNIGYFI